MCTLDKNSKITSVLEQQKNSISECPNVSPDKLCEIDCSKPKINTCPYPDCHDCPDNQHPPGHQGPPGLSSPRELKINTCSYSDLNCESFPKSKGRPP